MTGFPRSVPGAPERRLHDPLPTKPIAIGAVTPLYLLSLAGAATVVGLERAATFALRLLRRPR